MQRFLKWYKQSRKNKVIVFSIIFIVALLYSFLHRPLGLIAWNAFDFAGESQQIKAIVPYIDNEKRFLESYTQHNIADRFHKSQKEIFRYIDDFEIDLLASSFVGLAEWYIQSFLSKSNIYVDYFNLHIVRQAYHKNAYTQENINMFIEFLDKNQKVSFFIDNLALKDDEFESYVAQHSLIQLMLTVHIVYFFTQEQICALPDRGKISNVLMRFYDAYQKMKSANKTYKMAKDRQGDTFDSNMQMLLNLHNTIKDKLNECE